MSTKQNKSTGTSSFRAFTVLVRQQEVHPACKSLLKLFPTVLLKDATKPRATQELKLTACWTKNMKKHSCVQTWSNFNGLKEFIRMNISSLRQTGPCKAQQNKTQPHFSHCHWWWHLVALGFTSNLQQQTRAHKFTHYTSMI